MEGVFCLLQRFESNQHNLLLPRILYNIKYTLPRILNIIYVFLPCILSISMFYQRKIYKDLLEWKTSMRRKPLILRGARQVGKSTLVREFSKEYDHYIELNLERKEERQIFEIENVKEILELILLRERISIESRSLLLFIDEIQASPKAIQLLRFFYEDFPDLHIICAGSLLEHAIKDIPSFPVGRIQQMVLHPFDFEEFLRAKGDDRIIDLLDMIPVKESVHDFMLKRFHEYVLIGGMPEVVKTYIETDSFSTTGPVYEEIWETYKDDVEKYGKNSTEKKMLRHIIATAAHEKDRITFSGFGNSNYRNREVGEALRSLDKARLIRLIYPAISVQPPQEIDYKRKPRLQFLDTGLLNHALGIQSQMIGMKEMNDFHRGRIIQHIVYQQLQAQNSAIDARLHFWVREQSKSNAEVDLVYQYQQFLLPIEVKAGSQGRLRSLHQFIEKTNHHYAIRLLSNRLSIEKVKTPGGKAYTLLNLPYYLSTRIPQYAKWLTEKA
ncbi:MAG: AAA family ATPase [Bacteroidota bacterium]